MDRPALIPSGGCWSGDLKQREAAWAPPEAKLVVIAGPGTGKTEVAAQRLLHLMRTGLTPAQILVLSFSNSAVRTLTRRLEQQGGTEPHIVEDLRYLSVRTFDSWTFRMLRRLGETPRDLLARGYDANIAELTERISNKQSAPAIREQLKNVRHVIVDEFQDLAGVRGALVVALLELIETNSPVGFTVLGDDAQAIYGYVARQSEDQAFAHVSMGWLLERLRAQHPGLREVVLEKNYRAISRLADLAQRLRTVLRSSESGVDKLAQMTQLVAALPETEGGLDSGNVPGLEGGSLAVLTRTNGEALQVAKQLAGSEDRAAISVIVGSANHQRTVPGWVGALLGRAKGSSVTRAQFSRIYQHVRQGSTGAARAAALCLPDEPVAWTRLLRAAGLASDASSFELAQLRDRMGWLDAFPDDEGIREDAVHVMTIHQSKGMEFKSVGLLASDESPARSDEEVSEEASVIFVAVTRAGRKLVRVPSKGIYKLWRDKRSGRWYSARNGRLNVEVGLTGDIDIPSFVDTRLHGSDQQVLELQTFLADHAAELAGRKVMLKKRSADGTSRKQIYAIHLQEGSEPGRLLGAMTSHLTLDLLGLIKGLPYTLMNLRIAEITTLQGNTGVSPSIASEYASSGLWLGLQLHGVAFAFYRGQQ